MTSTLSKKAAREGDIVELTEDQPKYNLTRGQRAVVITEFEEPGEAYDLAVEDKDGELIGFAYSIKANQINNITCEAFEGGMKSIEEGNLTEAERQLEEAVRLAPKYRGVILNSVLTNFAHLEEDWESVIILLRLLVRISPDYNLARDNLAIAYLNHGVQRAIERDLQSAQMFYSYAIAVSTEQETVSRIQGGFAAVYTELGVNEYAKGNYEQSMSYMRLACACSPNETTRRNLGVSHVHLARFYMEHGKYKAAVEAFQIAEEAGLLLPELLNDQGVALVFTGQIKEAARVFHRALALEPNNKTVHGNLAKLNEQGVLEGFIAQKNVPEFTFIQSVMPQSFALAQAA